MKRAYFVAGMAGSTLLVRDYGNDISRSGAVRKYLDECLPFLLPESCKGYFIGFEVCKTSPDMVFLANLDEYMHREPELYCSSGIAIAFSDTRNIPSDVLYPQFAKHAEEIEFARKFLI